VLKIGQGNKVWTTKMVMEKSQENMERSVKGKGKYFINLFVQKLEKQASKQLFFQNMLLSQGRMTTQGIKWKTLWMTSEHFKNLFNC
jgi:hypothetical protein